MAEQKPVAWAVGYDGKSPEHDFIAGDCGERVKAMAKGIGGTAQAIEAWRGPVIDEIVSCGIYSAAHDADPRKAIKDAIAWNVAVALDPLVSIEARKLVEAAKAEEREACIEDARTVGGAFSQEFEALASRRGAA